MTKMERGEKGGPLRLPASATMGPILALTAGPGHTVTGDGFGLGLCHHCVADRISSEQKELWSTLSTLSLDLHGYLLRSCPHAGMKPEAQRS